MTSVLPVPAHTSSGIALNLVSLPQTELLTINVSNIPMIRDAMGPGIHVQPLRLDVEAGVWMVLATFSPGSQVPLHYHTGIAETYTLSGKWYYLEYPDQPQTAGSYLYEPSGSVHTLVIPETNTEDTVMLARVEGSNINFSEDGQFHSILDAVMIHHLTTVLSEQQGLGPINYIGGGEAGFTANPMVISWPARIKDPGGMRSQFHHVIDIAPTILDVVNIAQPVSVNGNAQKPIEGISLAYTFDDASAPGQRSTQYFEMLGNRAIYHDGWVAGCRHGKLPWQTVGSASFDNDTWELYNIDVDFSQANDLAKDNADRLSDMQDMFMAEAKKYNVLPLDDRFAERADASLRPNPLAGRKTFVYLPGTVRIPEPVAPNTKNVDHTIAAEVEIPPGGAKGALVSMGGESAGYTLFVHDGKLVWEHNWFNDIRYRVTSDEVIPPGRHVLSAEIRVDDKTKPGTGGNVILRSGEKVIGKGRFDKQVPYRYTVNETFDIGCSLVTPVSNLYESPATFTGKVDKVIIDISGESLDDLAMREKIALGTQ